MFSSEIRARRVAILLLALLCVTSEVLLAQSQLSEAKRLQQEGRAAALHKQLDQAFDAYQRAVQLAPRDARLRIEYATVLKLMGRYSDAISSFQEALKIAPRSEAAELGLADAYRLVFNYARARQLMEQARKEHSARLSPLIALGELDLQLQKYDDAASHFQRALRLDRKNIAARNDLALTYKAESNFAKAVEILNDTLSLDPENALAHYLRGSIYADRNDNEKALRDAEKVVALEPGIARGRLLLGRVQVRLHQCSQAAEVLEPLAAGPEGDSGALFLLWQAYRCAGDNERAQQTVTRFEAASKQEHQAQENKTQADHLVDQAEKEALANHLQPAMDLLLQALEKQPENSNAHVLLAKINYSLGQNGDAHKEIDQALKIHPFAPEALYVLGKVLEQDGKLDEALEAFRQTTIVNPAESDAYYEMGLVYREKNDKARAVEAVKKALEISPGDPDYRRALAELTAASNSDVRRESKHIRR